MSIFSIDPVASLGDAPGAAAPSGGSTPPPSGSAPSSVQSFVEQNLPAAQRVAERLGVAPEAVLGQWGLETGWGKKVISGTNNLGNIKDPTGKGVWATDNATKSNDAYRKYASTNEFADDFARLLSSPRYANAVGAGGDYQAYFSGLKRGGYAEDKDYVAKGVSAANMAAQALGGQPQALRTVNNTAAPASAPVGAPIAGGEYFQPQNTSRFANIPQAGQGATLGDFAKEFGASALDAIGGIGQAVGEAGAYIANKATGTQDYEGKNLLKPVSTAIRGSMTEGGKQAARDANVEGSVIDLFNGNAPLPDSVDGWLMMGANGFGSLVPTIGSAFIGGATKAAQLSKAAQAAAAAGDVAKAKQLADAAQAASRLSRAVGAVTGGAMTGGAAAGEVRQTTSQAIAQMPHEQLLAEVPVYAEVFNQTGDEGQARSAVVNSAARWAGGLSAIAGAAGGYFNAKVFEDFLTKKGIAAVAGKSAASAAGRVAIAAPLAGLAEGGQEVSEKFGQNVGENIALGRPASEDALRNTAGDFLGGALVGGPIGGAVGISAPTQTQAAPATNPAITAVQERAAQGNSPLSAAAAAGNAATPQPVTPQLPTDPLAERVSALDQQVVNNDVIAALRDETSPVDARQFVGDLALARSPSAPQAAREQALARIEFAIGWVGQNRPAAPTPGDAPADAMTTLATAMSDRDLIGKMQPTDRQRLLDISVALKSTGEGGLPAQTRSNMLREALQIVGQYQAPTETGGTGGTGGQSALLAPRPAQPASAPETPAADPAQNVGEAVAALNQVLDNPLDALRAFDANDIQTLMGIRARLIDESVPVAERAQLAAQVRSFLGADIATAPEATAQSAAEAAAPKTQQTVATTTAPAVEDVAAPKIKTVPAGPGPAVTRKRRAALDQLAGMGFDRVERRDDGFYFINPSKRQQFKLDGVADAALAQAAAQRAMNAAAQQAATSNENDKPQPTEGQAKAGQYAKGDITFDGLKIAVENPVGSTRSGTDPSGENWSVDMTAHYGFVRRTEGADGDQVDVYVPANARPGSPVFVFDQHNDDGSFDEHKAVLGVKTLAEAQRIYDAHFSDGSGPRRRRAVTQMTMDEFKVWAKSPEAKIPGAAVPTGQTTVFPASGQPQAPLPAGTPIFERGTERPVVVDESAMPEEAAPPVAVGGKPMTSKTQAAMLRQVANVFGKQIVFFDGINDDGFVMPSDHPDRIFLNIRSGISPLAVFGHELMHLLKRQNPAAYAAIARVIRTKVKDAKGFRNDYYGRFVVIAEDGTKAGFRDKTTAQAALQAIGGKGLITKQTDKPLAEAELEELISDLNGNLMRDQKFWKEVFDQIKADNGEQAQGIIARLAAFIQTALDNVVAAFQGRPQFRANSFVKDAKEIRAALSAALASYAKNNGVTRTKMQADVLREKQVVSLYPGQDGEEAANLLKKPVRLTDLDEADEIDAELTKLSKQPASAENRARIEELTRRRDDIAAIWPKAIRGKRTEFATEAGPRVAADYAIIDADDLITSHDVNLRENPQYPQALQPRDRSRMASQAQVSKIANSLDPNRLGFSADAVSGAPIVGADGLVESGNARTIALKQVYQANGQKAADYRAWLASTAAQFGLTAEQVQSMRSPVLVRVRTTPVNRAEFARQANAPTVARMSASEQAMSDAKRMTSLEDLDPTEDGDFGGSLDFIRRFVNMLPTTEQADMIDSDGRLSTVGYRRIESAVLAKAYGNSPVLRRLTESRDDNMRNVLKALVRVAPMIASMRERIQAGALHDADLSPHLVAAVEGLSSIKDRGWTLEQELAQGDLTGPKYTPEATQLMRMMSENSRSPRAIAENLRAYYQALEAAGDPRQESIFGDAGPEPTVAGLLREAKSVTMSAGRAAPGGQVADANGYFYKGGQFLPTTSADPGKWKVGKKWVKSRRELVAPGEFAMQPTPFSRSLFSLAAVGYFTQLNDDRTKLSVRPGVRDYNDQPVTGGMVVRPGVNGVLGRESLTLQDIIDAWNAGQRWFDVNPEGPTVTTKDDDAQRSADREPDWMTELFGGQADEAAPAPAPAAARDYTAAVPALRQASEEALAQANDWASRRYKANRRTVALGGDGPRRSDVMSVSAANESRRRQNVEYFTEQARNAARVAQMIERGDDVESTVAQAIRNAENDIKRDGRVTIGQTRADQVEAYISGLLFNSNAYGPGTPARMMRQAHEGDDVLRSAERVGDAQLHNLVAERGERVVASRVKLSDAERKAIVEGAKLTGLSEREIERQVRTTKAAHPEKDGWAPVVFLKMDVKKDEEEGGKPTIDFVYKAVPYSFNTGPDGKTLKVGTKDYDKAVTRVARNMVGDVREVYRRAQNGDQAAKNIIGQSAWYKTMRTRLRQEFGGLGDLFADLLGATSPNTPVRGNWANAVDSLRRAMRGDFDALMPKWVAWVENVEQTEARFLDFFNAMLEQGMSKKQIKELGEYKWLAERAAEARKFPDELLPTKESGRKYGFNGKNVVRAMVDLWRTVNDANPDINRGGTAPKALNFSGNLIGFRERATIDVWAARNLQRNAGKPRIASATETGVSGEMRRSGETTLQFGFGQDVFSEAVGMIRSDRDMSNDPVLAGINDDDLQALVWFVEKEIWTKNNWTSSAGEGGSFEFESDLAGVRDQDRVRQLRKTADSTVSATREEKREAQERIWEIANEIDPLSEAAEAMKKYAAAKARASKSDAEKGESRAAARTAAKDADALVAAEKRLESAMAALPANVRTAKQVADKIKGLTDEAKRLANVFDRLLPEELRERRIEALRELSGIAQTVDRFVLGMSIQQSADLQGRQRVPSDLQQAAAAKQIHDAAYLGDDGQNVIAVKVYSTEGRYGEPERALDGEIIARDGYDPRPLASKVFEVAQRENQDAAFVARVLRATEQFDPLLHRPGVEIYFRDASDAEAAEAMMRRVSRTAVPRKDPAGEDRRGRFFRVGGFTVVVDGRRSPEALSGAMPPAVGMRIIYLPEFNARYGDTSMVGLDDDQLRSKMSSAASDLDEFARRVVSKVPGVSFGGMFRYEVDARFINEYQGAINAYANRGSQAEGRGPGGQAWSGRSVREAVAAAVAGDGTQRAESEREVSDLDRDTGAGIRRSRDRDGSGREEGRGDARRPLEASERAVAQGALTPLPGAPQVRGATGPDPRLVAVADRYARDNGIQLRRQAEYVQVDPERAARIADAYAAMPHDPQNPQVKEAYQNLVRQTRAQYDALADAGYKFWFVDLDRPDNLEYVSTPWNAMRDIRANQEMGVFPTADGFGSNADFDPEDNPLLADTGLRWPVGGPGSRITMPVLANDLFRAVHDAFGHGLEGAGFRAQGEENAWQAHVRLFTGSAIAAITSETRGQNSWLNYGPHGETNRTAKVEDTIFADQKTGLMPSWTWEEGRVGDADDVQRSADRGAPAELARWTESLPIVEQGEYEGGPAVFVAYHGTTHNDITVFNRQGDPDGFLGAGPYFTTSPEDASANYAGIGPDLTARISRESERLADAFYDDDSVADDMIRDYLNDRGIEDEGDLEDLKDVYGQKAIEHAARKQLQGASDGLIMKSFVKLKNPADTVNGKLTYIPEYDDEGDFVSESGTLIDWIERAREVGAQYGSSVDRYIDALLEQSADGDVPMSEAFRLALKHLDGYDDNGEPIGGGGVFSIVAQEAGYDGVVMDAYLHFGGGRRGFMGVRVPGMAGVEPSTLHIVPFKADAVKSATGNVGAYGQRPVTGEEAARLGFRSAAEANAAQARGDVRLSRDRQIDTPAFKRWFGRSKAVIAVNAETGRPVTSSREPKKLIPQVMYHTTRGDFSEFQVGRVTRNSGTFGDWETSRAAIFVTPEIEASQAYGTTGGEFGEGANVMPLYVRAENPLDLTSGVGEQDEQRLIEAGMSPRFISNGLGDWSMFDDEEGANLVEMIRRAGYDSVIFNDQNPDTGDSFEAWALFDPEQIKSAIGNSGSFDPGSADIRRSSGREPQWYSQLQRAIAGVPDRLATMAAPQWAQWLKANAGKLQVKAEEITWSGIEDYLKLRGKDKITREELAAWVGQNGVRVEETVLDDGADAATKVNRDLRGTGYTAEFDDIDGEVLFIDPDGEMVDYTDLPPEIQEIVDRRSGTSNGEAKYGQYTIPGGENYREVLLTLPPAGEKTYTFVVKQGGGRAFRFNGVEYATEQEARAAEVAARKSEFKSNHWDQPNVLAHLRVNDREDADGNRVLFVEEIQSDWGQEGKKKGFASKAVSAEKVGPVKTIPGNGLRDREEQPWRVTMQDGSVEERALPVGVDPMRGAADKDGPPIAPFVTKTENWLALALKRVLLMAVGQGYDKVAFTTGQQNADRYDLSKQIDSLKFGKPKEDGTIAWVAMKDGAKVAGDRTPAKDLEGVVGKEVAQKILDHDGQPGELSGLDLQVGGEGMKSFYDQIVPNAVRALAKKLGGRVETVEMERGKPSRAPSEGTPFLDWMAAKHPEVRRVDAARAWSMGIDNNSFVQEYYDTIKRMSQPGLVITPEMREQIQDGLPLFSRDRGSEPDDEPPTGGGPGRRRTIPSGGSEPRPRPEVRYSSPRVLDMMDRRAQQLLQEEEREDWEAPASLESVALVRDIKYVNDVVIPLFRGLLPVADRARRVMDVQAFGIPPQAVTDAQLTLKTLDQAWRNLVEFVDGDPSGAVSRGTAAYNLRYHLTDAGSFKSALLGYLDAARELASSLSRRSKYERPVRKALEEALDDNVVDLKRSAERAVEQGFLTENQWNAILGEEQSGRGDRLKRFFHGTADDVSPGFAPGHRNKKDSGWLGDGIYVTDDPELAYSYSMLKKGGAAPNVMPLAVRVRKPYIATMREKRQMARMTPEQVAATTKRLIDNGYDSVLLNYEKGQSELVVLNGGGGDVRSYHAGFKEGANPSGDLLFSRQRAWHGTPHRGIDKFSTEFLGTGEGAQAYGYGLYFASKRDVAEYYRKTLNAQARGDTKNWKADGKDTSLNEFILDAPSRHAGLSEEDAKNAAFLASEFVSGSRDTPAQAKLEATEMGRAVLADMASLKKTEGQLYEVEIPKDSEMLDWDKPIGSQPEAVRAAVAPLLQPEVDRRNAERERMNALNPERLKHPVIGKIASKVTTVEDIKGQDAYEFLSKQEGSDKDASALLAGMGIKGIKYLDGSSRADGDGTHNYVVFSGDDVDVIQTYYSRDRVTNTPEFQEWFGDSKVVDESGRPLVVYHGTSADVTAFDGSAPRARQISGDAQGFYFTRYPEDAGNYAGVSRAGSGAANVMPVFLRIVNPKIVKASDGFMSHPAYISPVRRAELAAQGYDGVIYEDGEEIVVFRPEQIKSVFNRGTFDPENPDILASRQRAWHGTPHRGIGKFSTEFLGTGEGAQAYGHGLYFASKRDVAEYYRNKLSTEVKVDGEKLASHPSDGPLATAHNGVVTRISNGATPEDAISEVIKYWRDAAAEIAELAKGMSIDPARLKREIDSREAIADAAATLKPSSFVRNPGQLYEVEIPGDDEMLDWDKPIGSQPTKVKEALKQSGLWKALKDNLSDFSSPMDTRGKLNGGNIYAFLAWKLGSEKAASERLLELGIPGLRYPAGQIAGVKGGGYNYVIFSGDDVAIQKTYYSRDRQTETPEFKAWFRKSKVVDENGRPLVVYHGTNKNITAFRSFRPTWLAENPSLANMFTAGGRRKAGERPGRGSVVYPAFIRLENPLDLGSLIPRDEMSFRDVLALAGLPHDRAAIEEIARNSLATGSILVWDSIEDPVSRIADDHYRKRRLWSVLDDGALIKVLKSAGYDGLKMSETIVGGTKRNPIEAKSTTYAVFSPEQIKSVFNERPTNDPDILRSTARTMTAEEEKENFPADGYTRLYHAGDDPIGGGHFSEVPSGERFDGFFALSGRWGNYGNGAKYFADIPDDRILSQHDLDYEIDAERVTAALHRAMPWLNDADTDVAWRAAVEDNSSRVDEDDMVRVFREDSVGEASWEAQRIRGAVAKELGYDAVEMEDENGGSYLIVSGVPLTRVLDEDEVVRSRERVPVERVDISTFGWRDQDDGYLYHVTSEPNAQKILRSGFTASGKRMFSGGSYAARSAGKTFFTERGGVKFWESRVEDALFDQYDDPPEVAVLRVPKQALGSRLQPDELGTQDANRPAFYVDNSTKLSPSRFDQIRDVNLMAGYKVADMFDSSRSVGWWDRTVGTMYRLAEKQPLFKRVYDAVQSFINDVSRYATRAADLAPTILPKLENLRDITKTALSAEDVKALAGPIFEGTLRYERDAAGNAVETDDVGKAGVVWKDEELRQKWGLDDRQIGLYREFRRAANKSIGDLAITDMLRYAGDDAAGVRSAVLAAGGVQQAADILVQELQQQASVDPTRAGALLETARVLQEKANAARGLMAKGYAPLSRYGDFTVYATNPNGEQLYFGMFETQREANRMARQMREQYPDADVKTGTMSKESYKLFSGVTPETLALFGQASGLEEAMSDDQKQAFDDYLKLAKSNRSAMKRLIERKGIAGYSEDVGRVLAGFVYSNARQASVNLHAGEIGKSVWAIKEAGPQQGDLLDQAVKLMQYVQNGQEEAQKIRGLLFAQYIGGSVASAMTNLTQSLTTTWPTLAMHFGVGRSGRALTAALGQVKSNAAGDADLQAALKRAEEEGITAPQEVHHLMAQAQGRGSLQTGDGTKFGDTLAKINNGATKLKLIWGKAFGFAEQLNRKIAFAAAYSLAREKGDPNPFAFAAKIVGETQFTMNKGNNPNWARGPIGATIFTFRKFMVNYLEMLARLWGGGPEGKKAFALALGILFLLAGMSGMPGADDLDDLIDGFAQRVLNKNFSSRQAKKEFFAKLLGDAGADFVVSGLSGLPGVPLDVSGRLGLGNLVPGTGIAAKKADHSRDIAEIGGAAADFVSRVATAAGMVAQGDIRNATETALPLAAGNAYKAMQMAQLGYYKDAKNRKVIDTDLTDATLKLIGFQPKAVAQVQEATRTAQQMVALNKLRETEIAALWTRGRVERNPDMVEEAKRQLAEWNRDNPTSPIAIDAAQINRRVQQANQTKAQRIGQTAPKEIRQEVRRQIEANLNQR